ncbi:hypothetical protein A671_02659 [Salmonella enterica subsp. enterica serovar Dublin str. DG22]|uniref:Uncharacterized protein n=1 Tax=Salmonella typhi TaxID=90370 RepID=Q9L5H9_SALTI|nr:orf; hypothetical protein [Salmonella enterica subsp. enterica serovar Typhi]EPI69191.1 hypothetical protein A671_02659 [Salmonella enterica subsp. enterica serovar Dublin str. DG22]ESD43485.1 hypothetical protein HMPREF1604_01544 [Escherichia coli 908519]
MRQTAILSNLAELALQRNWQVIMHLFPYAGWLMSLGTND